MKKLSYILIGILIGAVLTYFYCPRQDAGSGQEVTAIVPKDTISVAKAKQFSKNWERHNPIEIDSIIEIEGSRKQMRSVWWSLDDINDYLIFAKTESDELGYNMTGLRIYLGNYGNTPDPIKKNRNTMFIVPTGSIKTSKASSININLRGDDDDIPAPPLNDGIGGDGGYPQ